MKTENLTFRSHVKFEDIEDVTEIVRSTAFFREDEVLVARELIDEAFHKGKESGYEFIFAEVDGRTVAYSCYGLIPCTLKSYDLYWIATHNDFRGKGIGRIVLKQTEEAVNKLGGKTVYVETSSKEQYISTRIFYEKNDYILKAQFEDFYDIGDDKCVYIKVVS
jgi:N-acetylglutamate synthase-like GNAT family acetyltransferase